MKTQNETCLISDSVKEPSLRLPRNLCFGFFSEDVLVPSAPSRSPIITSGIKRLEFFIPLSLSLSVVLQQAQSPLAARTNHLSAQSDA